VIPRIRFLALLIALLVAATACSGGSDVSKAMATNTTTTSTTTTTVPPSTTTMETTTSAGLAVAVTLDGEDYWHFRRTVQSLYLWLADPDGVEGPELAEGFAEHLEGVEVPESFSISGTSAIGYLSDDRSIGVAQLGDDVVLGVNEGGTEWVLVGGKLASLGSEAWYGDPVRRVMIIGTDARWGQDQPTFRGDSLHVVASAIDEGSAGIVGFPRDSWVDVPYGGSDKYTHVNVFGGTDAVVEIAEDIGGFDIEGYILTGFQGFETLVDQFGGVTVDVPFGMSDYKSGAYFNAGVQVMNGVQALAFSRNRSITGGDFTRSGHQGVVMMGALGDVQEAGILMLPWFMQVLDTNTWTDLPLGDLLTLAAGAYEIDPEKVGNVVLPGFVATRGAAQVVILTDAAPEVLADLEDGMLTEQTDD
jgi:LCP family protein required for cell wall assembly